MCDHDHSHDTKLTRRTAAKYSLYALLAALAAAIPGKQANAGYGRCSKCNCPEYSGNQALCGNCGHRYEDHW
jgi:uncharacterized paraquat-inducible protein A